MPGLTLSFKGQKLKFFTLGEAVTVIGRQPDCAVFIDSLAIEPQHAIIIRNLDHCSIEPASDEAAVLVNDARIEAAHPLADGDSIQVGKHTLSFSTQSAHAAPQPPSSPPTLADKHGWLQIQSGAHLGRTIRLEKAFTRIGSADSNLAVIAHRNDGYYLSHLNGEQTPVVNEREIGDSSCKLHNEDRVTVGELQVQFFSDSAQTPQESHDMKDTNDHPEQRKFRRIPFDVSVTLRLGDHCWQSTLADISLHGALVHTPENFEPADDLYRLEIHLEGGPDILMEARVAHQEAGHTGLRCEDIDVDSITHLRRLVELNLGDPELLERELSALAPTEPA